MIAAAISMCSLSVFLAAALFVISYVMWEVRLVYNLTAGEAIGVGAATLIVILLCLLLLSKGCADTVSPRAVARGDSSSSR
jgi:hypothetical protein